MKNTMEIVQFSTCLSISVFWLYYSVIRNKNYENAKIAGIAITYISYVISVLFQNPFEINLYYADCIGSIVSIVAILLHCFEIRKTHLGTTKKNLVICVNTGLLVFNFFFPFYILGG